MITFNTAYWTHNLDPGFFRLAGIEIRFYGLFFALAMLQGGLIWIWQIRRSGRPWEEALPLIWMGIISVIVGGRLGNIFFYNLEYLFKDPLELLTSWRSGFASHGSTLGLLGALWVFSRGRAMPYLEALDRFSLSIPLATTCVRLGNFINGEIVGKASSVPWAVIYPIYDRSKGLSLTPRHPSQLYEAVMGVVVFAVLFSVDRKLGEKRPLGLMTGLILGCYFSGRFLVEFLKEPHVLDPSIFLNMGQILSIPFAAIGWWLVATRIKGMKKAPDAPGA